MENRFIVKIQMSLNPKETSLSQSKWSLMGIGKGLCWNQMKFFKNYWNLYDYY